MMTECFKPFYPAMCVSLRHLYSCRHGSKFKSSNWFCPTLYYKFYCNIFKDKQLAKPMSKLAKTVSKYHMYLNIRRPCIEDNSALQPPTSRKLPMKNMFNLMCDYKAMPHHSSDDEFNKILIFYSGKYCIMGKL
jgi:hypothetical protein